MRYYLEIHAAGRTPERLEFSSRLAFVTRDGANVALPARDCPSELHSLEIDATPAGVHVQVPQGAPGAFALNGEPQRGAIVPWGGEVFWENQRLAFIQVAKAKERSPVVMLGLVGILLCGGFAVANKTKPDRAGSEPEPPQLVVAVTTCVASDSEVALRRAQLAERAALAQREQSAFIAADGLAALSSFSEAEACYRVAGQGEEATRVAAVAAEWREHLNADYAATRLRLQLALSQRRDADALRVVTALQRLLNGRSGPYVDWLATLRVELEGLLRRQG